MLYQGKDGELRIIGGIYAGVTHYYQEVLFCEMDCSLPSSRPRTEESLKLNRGQMDSDAHYVEGPDDPIYAPIPVTFSARLADTYNTYALLDMISGLTQVANNAGGTTTIPSWDDGPSGTTVSILGNSLPKFADAGKTTYRLEVVWNTSASASTLGFRLDNVYFTPGEQNLTESADGLILSCNGQIYGGVSRITDFTASESGVTYSAFV